MREASGTSWPIHEVGRNPDIFPPEAGRLLQKNSSLALSAYHCTRTAARRRRISSSASSSSRSATSRSTSARRCASATASISTSSRIRANQELHSYATLQEHTKIIAFEPHLHAPGVRMCLEAIWGHNILTLNCVGYDHNWVKQYVYEDDKAPLLPKGTIVHLIGFLDTTQGQQESRRTRGTGRAAAGDRSPTCSSTSATRCRSPKSSSRPRWPSAAPR